MKLKVYITSLVFSSILGGIVSLSGYKLLFPAREHETIEQKQTRSYASQVANRKQDSSATRIFSEPDFVHAANQVRPAVVHIKTRYARLSTPAEEQEEDENPADWLREFHGYENPFKENVPRESAGSGVIIASDGYIATNNHVVEDASEIEVILEDRRSYSATVIGMDPTTDLALIKIEEENLPFAKYGNSDQLHIGEWVLAIGNPFDLTSTVTAGIVSGKGRNINILKDKDDMQIESFIQTDAAVNPGNSGGALVNAKGELIGINTAIASNTGISQGYSFAVPIRLAEKVIDDLLRFGSVQRGLLGVRINDVNARTAKDNGLNSIRGVLIEDVNDKSAAHVAGLHTGDVIFRINSQAVNSSAELQSIVGTHRPGDRINVYFEREGEEKSLWVTLRNSSGTTVLPRPKIEKTINIFGADMAPATLHERRILGTGGGVKILRLTNGRIKEAGMRVGFIITHLGGQSVSSAEDIFRIINASQQALVVEGVFANGAKSYHAIAP